MKLLTTTDLHDILQIVPIVYTIDVSFTTRPGTSPPEESDAIRQIQLNSLQPPANGKQSPMAAADPHRRPRADPPGPGQRCDVRGNKGLQPIRRAGEAALGITKAKGYADLEGRRLRARPDDPRSEGADDRPERNLCSDDLHRCRVEPTLRYDAKNNTFTRITDGVVFRDNNKGSFTHGKQEFEPGWKTGVGLRNFGAIIHDPLVSGRFFRIFIWTFVFAVSVVFLSFSVGLLLAIALDKKGLRFQRVYRSLVLIPWAVPGFLSLLVWQGLLNDDFGVVNRILHLNIPWLFDGNWAKVSCILVSFWLTVPYFFLVSMGALQAIPVELTEAARVDGGGPMQIFRKVTLPLLLVAVSPLLIASFAFNFNNFNNIFLLTGGGPTQANQPIAGSTDILISYTYKLAIAAGKGQDYGLASAVSIIVFVVATISAVSFSRTKALENLELSALTAAMSRVRAREEKTPRPKLSLGETWWRQPSGLSRPSPRSSRCGSGVGSVQPRGLRIRDDVSAGPFHARQLRRDPAQPRQGPRAVGYVDSRFLHWLLNTIIIATITAVITVILGALAAYAFSRFRFKGRRMGMLALLLIQMFPQLLLVVALYLIVLNTGSIFPVMGLNTYTGLIIVYLGGSLGVNAWLLKGFLDTIPSEVDQSARVDGATAAQIFWGVVLPLAAPILVVVGLISFISTLNEFVIASAMMQTTGHFTLPVGMNGFIDQQYGQRWGPFAAGTVLAAIPAAALFISLQKWLVSGLTQGSVKG